MLNRAKSLRSEKVNFYSFHSRKPSCLPTKNMKRIFSANIGRIYSANIHNSFGYTPQTFRNWSDILRKHSEFGRIYSANIRNLVGYTPQTFGTWSDILRKHSEFGRNILRIPQTFGIMANIQNLVAIYSANIQNLVAIYSANIRNYG